MESSDTSWNLQWTWGSAGFAGGESYDLWVRIKADHTVANPGGNAFRFGVWDNGSSTEIVPTTPVPASATQDMVYQDIRIGTFTPGVNQYVYVSGANNADISYVYVDKYWFVGKQTAQEAKLDLLGNAVKVTDGDASDGWSAKTQNNHNDWNIRWLWGNGLSFEPGLKYDLYATVKVDHVISGFTLPTGNAFKFGVWDNGSSTEIVPTTPVPVSISKDMVFRTYKIGTFVPETDQYAYIGGTNNAANVSDIYVDKFFFVPRGDNYLIAVNRNVFNSDTVTVSFPKTAVDKYGDGNVTANNVLTGNNITLSGTSTLSFSEILSPGGGIVVRLKSNRVSIP
ncbi:MAG: hypothetical protein HY606_02565 [Planctomycetes bacterium]|nr:hypothetical protein [Planctomycetota bacterium]